MGQRRGLERDKKACCICFGLKSQPPGGPMLQQKALCQLRRAHHSLLQFERADDDPASQEAVPKGETATITTTDTMTVV